MRNFVLSRIINLLWVHRLLFCYLSTVQSHSLSSKRPFFSNFFFFKFRLFGLYVIQRWCKINAQISINNNSSLILVFWFQFQNIQQILSSIKINTNSPIFGQTDKISQMNFQNSLWVFQLNKFCFMGSDFSKIGLWQIINNSQPNHFSFF